MSWPTSILLPGGKALVYGGSIVVNAEDCCCHCPYCDATSMARASYTLDPAGFTPVPHPWNCPCDQVSDIVFGNLTLSKLGECCWFTHVGTCHIKHYANGIDCANDVIESEGDYDIAASLVCMTGGEYQLTLTAGPDILFSGLRGGTLGLDGLTFTNTCTTAASTNPIGCPGFPGPIGCCLVANTATITVHAP